MEEEVEFRFFRWDVFLSFRGEDTRDNFTEHLYNELDRNYIRTFRDDEELERGEEIAPSLLTAIEDSAVCIAVISENYASSRWCLEELAKIFECRRLILPVFYRVDPSDVRRQKGSFEDAFRNHETRFTGSDADTVLRWRDAMTRVGGIRGWHFKNGKESQLIQSLVKEIMAKISKIPPDMPKHPVRISSRAEEVMSLLDIKSNGVRVVGFHGMGGIGKTTLAKVVYNKIGAQFENCSFISNIRETSGKHNGLVSLQNQLIRDLFPMNGSHVNEINEGTTVIKANLHVKRVLVVLDDVDNIDQLQALAGKKDWFHEGSRIIITTREIQDLPNHLVDHIYELKELSSNESLQLFSYHAFGKAKPAETFLHVSKEIVSLAGGLPLALEVLGAFLFKRRIKEWEDALEKLKKNPLADIHKKLKISFDGLDEEQKFIFLDIACFFVRMEMKREDVIDILKGCGFNAELEISILTGKSLIKIIDGNILWMHDQIRDMGRQIVRQESLEDPGMRSRLWDHDEIMSVLKDRKGTRSIRGIILDFEEKNKKKVLTSKAKVSAVTFLKEKLKCSLDCGMKVKQTQLRTSSFKPMVNLRLLQINHANLEGKFKLMPNELKWVQWKKCPLEFLPSDFCPRELTVLDLSQSGVKHVWGPIWRVGVYKMAEKLMVLNLSRCYKLTTTPDFSGHPKLEKLILEGCTRLTKIHESIGDARILRVLNLKDCSNLKEFPSDVSGLRQLESLVLSGCSKLKELPRDLKGMNSLRELILDETAIEELPDSIFFLKKLEVLSINRCLLLKQLPSSIGHLSSLRELSLNGSSIEVIPESVGLLKNLEILSLMWCKSLAVVPISIGNLESLKKLFLDGNSIQELPASIGSLSHLLVLSVSRCQSLGRLPISIGGLASLVELQLDNTSIMELPSQIETLHMLEKLEMRNCGSLTSLPDSIGCMSNLTRLVLVNANVTALPESIGLLGKLVLLRLTKCKQLSALPASIGKLKSLRQLYIEETSVADLPEEFGMLSMLMVLKMRRLLCLQTRQSVGDCSSLTVLPTSFSSLSSIKELDARSCKISGIIPDDFEKLSSLEVLELGYNNFCSLPSCLRGLSILKKLSLPHCTELKSLPPLPSSLIYLDVTNCTSLESISDLSNLEHLQELQLSNCRRVLDIPGFENLKSLRRLYMIGCSECYSGIKGRFHKVVLKHLHNLSVPGTEIPDWFAREVASFSSCKNRDIKGVIVCVVVSVEQQNQDYYTDELPAIVDVLATITRENRIVFTTALPLLGIAMTHEDQVCLCRYPSYQRFVSMLKDGDKIQVTKRDPPVNRGVELKKQGIHLVYEDDDEDDCEEESLDETQKSVSEKLASFFRQL